MRYDNQTQMNLPNPFTKSPRAMGSLACAVFIAFVGATTSAHGAFKSSEPHVVERAWSQLSNQIVDVSTTSPSGESELISTTAEHPFLLASGEWVAAEFLREGAWLRDSHGALAHVTAIRVRESNVKVYNFEVEGLHNYAVGRVGVVVHNTACKPINLPSWKKIAIDIGHIVSGHTKDGLRAVQGKKGSLFPDGMSASQIEKAVRQAYKMGEKVSSQGGDRTVVQGEASGMMIEMYVNKTTKVIETAYQIGSSK